LNIVDGIWGHVGGGQVGLQVIELSGTGYTGLARIIRRIIRRIMGRIIRRELARFFSPDTYHGVL